MGDHAGPQALAPMREQTEQPAIGSHGNQCLAVIAVAETETSTLQDDSNDPIAGPGLELAHEITAKDELLTKAGGRSHDDPDNNLRNRFGQHCRDCLCGFVASQQVGEGADDDDADYGEGAAKAKVDEEATRRRPAATHYAADGDSTPLQRQPDEEDHDPLPSNDEEVARNVEVE